MTHQQELELLAEWLGIEYWVVRLGPRSNPVVKLHRTVNGETVEWNPSPEGNDTDFLNMVAGRVDIFSSADRIDCCLTNKPDETVAFDAYAWVADHNNDPVQAMKHAAYQVCLMAARESKESK